MSWLLWTVLLWTLGCMYLFRSCFYPSICPGVGFQDYTVALFLVFKGTSILFSIVAAPISFSPTVQEGFLLFTPSPAFTVCGFFDDGHSSWCEVIFDCNFDLHFSSHYQCWTYFHEYCSILLVFAFWEVISIFFYAKW